MRIYSETITVGEILGYVEQKLKPLAEKSDAETFLSQALPDIRETLRNKVTDVLLYQEARKTAPEDIDEKISKAVESEIARFVAGYGNNYALAENAIKRMGMDWKSFREYEKKLILTQSYISSTVKEEKRFAYRDLLDYYESVKAEQFSKPGFVEFSIIDIDPGNLTAEQAAADRIEEVLAKLDTGEDFAEVAKQYSHGPFAAMGGKLEPVSLDSGSLAEPYGTLAKEAQRMQPGQIIGPIEILGHLFVLKLDQLELGESKSFEEVQHLVEQQLQFLNRQKQYLELVQKLIAKADFVQLEQFSQFCALEAYNRWHNGAQ
ncbi:MAG: peptidylprolyl isomerase [Planctomycetes bacterium]|nr:peptidylprolyl isomerase [Planctomycetota bacterium]